MVRKLTSGATANGSGGPTAPAGGDGPGQGPSTGGSGEPGGGGSRASSPFVAVEEVQDNPEKVAGEGHRKRTIAHRGARNYIPRHNRRWRNQPAPFAQPLSMVSPKPPSVVRGEINVAPLQARHSETVAAVSPPSVLVELGPLATPVTVAPFAVPLTAQTASPSVIVAPMTPTPIATGRARPRTPVRDRSGMNHTARPPSNGFNDVEADFFDREADLYKRESVESFDDLDRKPGSKRPVGSPSRKR